MKKSTRGRKPFTQDERFYWDCLKAAKAIKKLGKALPQFSNYSIYRIALMLYETSSKK